MSTAKVSPNYKFNLPSLTDAANITDLSKNWEQADTLFADAWYKTATVIDVNKNLNDFNTVGLYIYSASTAATLTNIPEVSQGTMIVLPRLSNKDTNNITQVIVSRENSIYTRAKHDGNWTEWGKFASEASLQALNQATTSHINDVVKHIPNTCTITENWDTATKTGWYMSQGEGKNAPHSEWCFGSVIAHNDKYVLQEVYEFTKSSSKATELTKYIRSCYDGTWTNWIDVTVQRSVPEGAKFEYIKQLTSDAQTQIDTLTNNKLDKKPSNIELTPTTGADNGGYIDFHYGGSTKDYTARIIESADGEINIIGNSLKFSQNNIKCEIFGDHNKPSGTYVGNGSSSTRRISIGGVGYFIFVSGKNDKGKATFGIFSKDGGFYYTQDGTFVCETDGATGFSNGNLTIHPSTMYDPFNASGVTYHYQVL